MEPCYYCQEWTFRLDNGLCAACFMPLPSEPRKPHRKATMKRSALKMAVKSFAVLVLLVVLLGAWFVWIQPNHKLAITWKDIQALWSDGAYNWKNLDQPSPPKRTK